jgi:hypothetical protein
MAKIFSSLLAAAQDEELINWARASIDGMFSAGKGGGECVDHGFKGKGITVHALVEGNGMPLAIRTTGAKASERDQVMPLLDAVSIKGNKGGRPRKRPDMLQLDKGYDSRELRKKNPGSGDYAADAAQDLERPEATARRSAETLRGPVES